MIDKTQLPVLFLLQLQLCVLQPQRFDNLTLFFVLWLIASNVPEGERCMILPNSSGAVVVVVAVMVVVIISVVVDVIGATLYNQLIISNI